MATFFNLNGKVLNNTKVKITVNNQSYTRTTNAKGVVSLAVDLKPGSYKVVATNPKTGYSLTTTFKILSTIKANDVNKVYTDARRFTAVFLNSEGKALANKQVKFRINGNTYTVTTNAKGVASLTMYNLVAGTYKMVSYNVDGLTKVNTVKVVNYCASKLTAFNYVFLTSESKIVKVVLHNQFDYAPGEGKTVRLAIDGKYYYATTNVNGVAAFKLPSLSKGVYAVKYYYGGNSFYKASSASGKVTIIPSKTPDYIVKSTTTFGKGYGAQFKVALTSKGVPLAGRTVTLKLAGQTYTKTTDSNGVVSVPVDLAVGKYTVTYTNKAEKKVSSKTGSTTITVKERAASKLTWKSSTTLTSGLQTYKILLTNSSDKALAGKTVKFTLNSKNYTATTNSNGYVAFTVRLAAGSYTASYSFEGDNTYKSTKGSTKLTIKDGSIGGPAKISIKYILNGASSLKNYYEKKGKLPSTVTAAGHAFTLPEFFYLMYQAIYQLGNSNTKAITCIYGVKAPSSPNGDTISSTELYRSDYLTVANNIAKFIRANKQAPNYASSKVGNIIYSELVDAASRILTFYKENDKYMPNYVTIKYGSGSSSSSVSVGGLNVKNTIKNLAPYLKATTSCQVGNAAIKKIVNSLTSGLTTDKAKAIAIYNYVRDAISYSFYYDTRYGAVGTLNAKTGNCVDQAHLLAAMFRTAGLATRYEHGTCTFSSGSTYGHVWTQVLIGNVWVVADPTSSRNSFGIVNNWNTNYYTHNAYYASLPF